MQQRRGQRRRRALATARLLPAPLGRLPAGRRRAPAGLSYDIHTHAAAKNSSTNFLLYPFLIQICSPNLGMGMGMNGTAQGRRLQRGRALRGLRRGSQQQITTTIQTQQTTTTNNNNNNNNTKQVRQNKKTPSARFSSSTS